MCVKTGRRSDKKTRVNEKKGNEKEERQGVGIGDWNER